MVFQSDQLTSAQNSSRTSKPAFFSFKGGVWATCLFSSNLDFLLDFSKSLLENTKFDSAEAEVQFSGIHFMDW